VLALLVVLALILITASFGGSGGGALHSVQSGFLDVLSPIETGASKALTPVHDLINWVDDVDHASSQRDAYRKQLARANATIAKLEADGYAKAAASKLERFDSTLALGANGPVDATVIGEPNGLWVSHATINAGSADGVHVNDPVFSPDGVIGTVTTTAADSSVVTLINDPSSGVEGRDAASRQLGMVVAKPGSPGELELQDIEQPGQVKVGDLVVSAGWQSTHDASFFPAGLPIGTVTSVDASAATATVAPAADLGSLENVQVLTQIPST